MKNFQAIEFIDLNVTSALISNRLWLLILTMFLLCIYLTGSSYADEEFDISQVTDTTGGENLNPVFSFGGDVIVFTSDRDITGNNPDGNFEIFYFDITTGISGQLTHTTGCTNFNPVINSELNVLIFLSDCDLTGNNPDGNFEVFRIITGEGSPPLTDEFISTATNQITESVGIENANVTINADASKLAFVSNGNYANQNPDGNREIFLVDFNELTLIQVTDTVGGQLGNVGPKFSADGSRIVFTSDLDITGDNADLNREIFLYSTGPMTFFQVTDTTGGVLGNMLPQINSDGTKISFTSDLDITGNNPDLNSEIFLFDTVTLAFTQITDTSGCTNFFSSINSDGTRVAFSSDCDLTGENPTLNEEIFLFDSTDMSIRQITDSVIGTSNFPNISQDGSMIAFQSDSNLTGMNPDGNTEIFIAVAFTPGTGGSSTCALSPVDSRDTVSLINILILFVPAIVIGTRFVRRRYK